MDVSFEFDPAAPGRFQPAWVWEGKILGRISRDVLVQRYGEIRDATPEQVVQRYRFDIDTAARGKTGLLPARPPEPVILEIDDFND